MARVARTKTGDPPLLPADNEVCERPLSAQARPPTAAARHSSRRRRDRRHCRAGSSSSFFKELDALLSFGHGLNREGRPDRRADRHRAKGDEHGRRPHSGGACHTGRIPPGSTTETSARKTRGCSRCVNVAQNDSIRAGRTLTASARSRVGRRGMRDRAALCVSLDNETSRVDHTPSQPSTSTQHPWPARRLDRARDETRCMRPRHRAACDQRAGSPRQSPSCNMGMNEMPTIAPSGDCSLATV